MSLQSSIIQNLLQAPMSLADIQQFSNASLPTVRRAVQILTESQWINVTGQAEANGGRPAMLFGINESYYMIFGLQLQLPGIQLVAFSLSGQVLKRVKLYQGIIPEPSAVIRAVVDSINELMSVFPDRQAIGLGIAAPGYIDLNTGDIIAIGRVPSWKNFSICKHLTEATGLPVQIANDVDCMAIAELNNDTERFNKNMIYLGFCEGVKVSFLLKGEIFKSSIGNIGLIDPDLLNLGYLNDSDDIHHLLTSNGFNHIFEHRLKQLKPSAQKSYQSIIDLSSENEMFNAILLKAVEKDEICYPLVKDMYHTLSIALANFIHILQPDEVIIGGLLSSLPKSLFHEFESNLRKQIPPLTRNHLLVRQALMESKHVAAKGAIQYFLHSKLESVLQDIL